MKEFRKMAKSRHLKSEPNTSWTELRVEIKSISQDYGIKKEDLFEVNSLNCKSIQEKIWEKFSTDRSKAWLWESLKEKSYSIQLDSLVGFDIKNLIDQKESVWFLLNETANEGTKFWTYEGKASAIEIILNESYLLDEIIITSKKYEWVIIVNHHNYLIGTGIMIDKLKKLKLKII
jgi:hypothetical protein